MITGLSTDVVRRPLRQPFVTARRRTEALEVVRITLTDDAGRSATGEVTANPVVTGTTVASALAAAAGSLREALLGVDPTNWRAAEALVSDACPGEWPTKAAVCEALRLLAGGTAALLGVEPRLSTSVTVSAADPDSMAAAATALVTAGVGTIKLKLAGDGEDPARLRTVSRAVPEARLWLDPNQSWDADTARRVLGGWAGEPCWVEQPTPAGDWAAFAAVAADTPAPLLADESVLTVADVLAAADAGAAGINVKLAKTGTVVAALAQAEAAAGRGLRTVLGCMMESPAALVPALAVAARVAPGDVHDLDAGWWLADPSPLSYDLGVVS